MATNVHLTRELERFAHAGVESGRYNNVSEVVRSGLRLLQEAEDHCQRFSAMLRAAEDEADPIWLTENTGSSPWLAFPIASFTSPTAGRR